MGSLIEELQRREAAARREADELRSEIARLNGRLALAEETLARLEITRETVTEIEQEHAAIEFSHRLRGTVRFDSVKTLRTSNKRVF